MPTNLAVLIAFVFCPIFVFSQSAAVTFTKQTLTTDFISEGVAVADINKDGKPDVFAGTHWFEAPSWKKHDITTPLKFKTTEYSQSFLQFAHDVNFDGWTDVIIVGFPGEATYWFENPGKKRGHWKKHLVYPSVGNESPAFADIDGDGINDLVCNDSQKKQVIWVKAPASSKDTAWTAHVISSDSLLATHRFTHGLGVGDVNLDGRVDAVVPSGWWEAPEDRTQANWKFHRADLGADCAQMYVMDVDHDGDQDVISSSAHNYGIWWHEQKQSGDSVAWVHHDIFKQFSQSHGLRNEDINGDGHPDLVTGKRYYAHNGHTDPGEQEPPVIYWFEYKPGNEPQWTPHIIDDNSGAGLNFVVTDMNRDSLPDIVISNKKGVFVFLRTR